MRRGLRVQGHPDKCQPQCLVGAKSKAFSSPRRLTCHWQRSEPIDDLTCSQVQARDRSSRSSRRPRRRARRRRFRRSHGGSRNRRASHSLSAPPRRQRRSARSRQLRIAELPPAMTLRRPASPSSGRSTARLSSKGASLFRLRRRAKLCLIKKTGANPASISNKGGRPWSGCSRGWPSHCLRCHCR